VPTVACVSGDVYGGGIELLSCFDFVFSAPHVRFGLWQRRIGLSYGWGGGKRITQRLGPIKSFQKSVLADTVSAYEALRIGLVDEIVPEFLLEKKTIETLRQLESLPKLPFEKLKNWNERQEQSVFESLWHGTEHKDALKKFSKK
jgi:enoyl-CoA hydratase/carnithine racemase